MYQGTSGTSGTYSAVKSPHKRPLAIEMPEMLPGFWLRTLLTPLPASSEDHPMQGIVDDTKCPTQAQPGIDRACRVFLQHVLRVPRDKPALPHMQCRPC